MDETYLDQLVSVHVVNAGMTFMHVKYVMYTRNEQYHCTHCNFFLLMVCIIIVHGHGYCLLT